MAVVTGHTLPLRHLLSYLYLVQIQTSASVVTGVKPKMRPTNSVIYGTSRYTLQAIRCCAS